MINRREFIKQIGISGFGVAAAMHITGFESSTLKFASSYSPESQGVSSQGLLNFFDAVRTSGLEFHSIMVNRNGKTILEGWWEPFHKEYIHTLYSLSKSFSSTAIGLLHDEGKLTVNDKVISFFPDKLPSAVSDNLAAMRIQDLLTMNTGHDLDTMGRIRSSGEADWVKAFLSFDVPKVPGSIFLYNTGATYMLSAIAQKITGQNIMRYLQPRLFEPLGIAGADWETDSQGINVGGYGLRIRTQDILNFGQLYLQEGKWNGKQILSAGWIAEATKKQVPSQNNDTDWGQGYGYQFWRCKPGCYRGDGAYGQYCIVVPEKNAVIAITSETKDMGASMKLVWDHILPAMETSSSKAEDTVTSKKLLTETTRLSLPVEKTYAGETGEQILNKKSFSLEKNPFNATSVAFAFQKNTCELMFEENGKSIRVTSGFGNWITGTNKKEGNTLFAIPGRTPKATKFSSYYTWKDKSTLVIVVKYVENAHTDIFTFNALPGQVELSFNNSVSIFTNKPDERSKIILSS